MLLKYIYAKVLAQQKLLLKQLKTLLKQQKTLLKQQKMYKVAKNVTKIVKNVTKVAQTNSMAVYSSVWSCFAIMAVFGYYGHDVASYSLIIWRIVALYRLISPCIALYCTISHYITLYRTISPFLAVIDPNSFGLVFVKLALAV